MSIEVETTTNHAELDRKDQFQHKLIIGRFILCVDDDGRCEHHLEGALGTVVQLAGKNRAKKAALKIPKLLGETNLEIAYINYLMENEADIVESIFDGSINDNGLLSSMSQNDLRNQYDPLFANEQIGYLFIKFEKGKSPQFCQVRPHSDGVNLECIPPNIPNFPINTVDELTLIKKKTISDFGLQTIFVQKSKENQSTNPLIISQEEASISQNEETWFTCIPSVIYKWIDITLQQAILHDNLLSWEVEDHISLIQKIGEGLETLHKQGYLHADLRPANVVYSRVLTDEYGIDRPDSFVLSDYGSFAVTADKTRLPSRQEPTDKTQIAPSLEGERASIFYSLERKKGFEREFADTALIFPDMGSGATVVLGWRNEIKEKQKEIYSIIQNREHQENRKVGRLLKGDYIRLQDEIFKLRDSEYIMDGLQFLPCESERWGISANRVIMPTGYGGEGVQTISLDRTVEMFQWSAATDIYSLGIILLYTFFMKPILETISERAQTNPDDDNQHDFNSSADITISQNESTGEVIHQSDDRASQMEPSRLFEGLVENEELMGLPQSDSQNGADLLSISSTESDQASNLKQVRRYEDHIQLENEFEKMITYLNDKQFFNAISSELEFLACILTEKLRQKHKSSDAIAEELLRGDEAKKLIDILPNEEKDDPRLFRIVQAAMKRVTTNVPGAARVAQAMSGDGIQFIFLLRFALCCIHRQAHLEANEDIGYQMKPFSKNRLENPNASAVRRANHALKEIDDILKLEYSDKFTFDINEIGDFELRTSYQIDQDYAQLETNNDALMAKNDSLKQENSSLKNEFENLNQEKDILKGRSEDLGDENRLLKQTIANLKGTQSKFQNEIGALKQENKKLRSSKAELREDYKKRFEEFIANKTNQSKIQSENMRSHFLETINPIYTFLSDLEQNRGIFMGRLPQGAGLLKEMLDNKKQEMFSILEEK
ncbi:MAG: hypothetical protein AAF490_17550 [Chloroflexota bacterium]